MCPLAYGAIKKLTVSSNTPGNTLDAREALAVLAARHGDRSEYSKLSLTSPGTDADDAAGGPIDIIVDGLLALDRELGKPALNNPAQPRLWPADSAKKLGEAIASAHSKLPTGLQTVCRRSADPSMVSQLPTPLPTPYRPLLPTTSN
jgi:hypothetical protein